MNLIRTPGELITLVLFLTSFVVVPLVFVWIGSGRRSAGNSDLQQCLHCGAQNHKAEKRCYCCGFGLSLPQEAGVDAPLIQRVKQFDASRLSRDLKASSPPKLAVASLPADEASR